MFSPSPEVPEGASISNAQHISTTTLLADPISNKIPTELANHIFECYIDLHRELERDLINRPTCFGFDGIPASAPLTLGAVCRSWRYMAWADPTLWTKFVVNLVSEYHEHGPALVKEWLERTGDLPIDVALRSHVNGLYPREIRGRKREDAEAVVKTLNLYWSKLKSIDLRDVPWDLCSMLNGNSTSQSSLAKLCIGGLDPDSDGQLDVDAHPMFRATRQKPAPTALCLLSTIPFQLINIDWSKITTLILDDLTRQTAFTAISLCAGTLTTVTLEAIEDDTGDFDDADYWLPEDVVTLPALLRLTFVELGSEEGFSETLFDHITAPALKSLRYKGHEVDFEMPIDSIIRFIERSGCDIKYLGIEEPYIPYPDSFEDGLVPLLHAMPSLRKLYLTVSEKASVTGVVYALGQRDPETGRPTCLPCLRMFSCYSAQTFNWFLFPMIWMTTHPDVDNMGNRDFNVNSAPVHVAADRMELSVQLVLRGRPPRKEEDDYVDREALLALMAVKKQILGKITVMREFRRPGPSDYLEASVLHRFPTHRPEDLE